MKVQYRSPWVRAYLANNPVEAMAVSAIVLRVPGTLRLFGDSADGPWLAVYHLPGDVSFDGSRARRDTVLGAVEAATGVMA